LAQIQAEEAMTFELTVMRAACYEFRRGWGERTREPSKWKAH